MKNRTLTSASGTSSGARSPYVEFDELDGFKVPEDYRLFQVQQGGIPTNRWYLSCTALNLPDFVLEKVRGFGDQWRVRSAVGRRHENKKWLSFPTVDEALSTMIARARLGLNEQE